MMRVWNALLLAVALTSPAFAAPLKGPALEEALQGVWCQSDDGGKTCFGYDHFRKGIMNSCGRVPETGQVVTLQTDYEVRGNRLCHTAVTVNKGSLVSPGDIFCMDVLDIGKRTQRYRLLSGETITVYRVPESRMRCPKPEPAKKK